MIARFDPTNVQHVREALDEITYDERYEFVVRSTMTGVKALIGIELMVRRRDAITGAMGTGFGGVRWLGEDASKSDLVRTAFGAILSYNEHEAREFFRYNGRQIFGPHGDVDALWIAAARTDYREKEAS